MKLEMKFMQKKCKKTENNILIAFWLNLAFSILEFIGGIASNSVAIISDSIHDFGDALSIGVSYVLERKSKKEADDIYTFGYGRYSVLGGLITIAILLAGSLLVINRSVERLITPEEVNYDGMILFAIFGVITNYVAAYCTSGEHSVNQKAVNLHMFEDVLGWIIVLIGGLLMKITDISLIDPILSIGVAVYILVHSIHHAKEILDIILEKVPEGIDLAKVKNSLLEIDEIKKVVDLHAWSINGQDHCAIVSVIANGHRTVVKEKIQEKLSKFNIVHITAEIAKEESEEDSLKW